MEISPYARYSIKREIVRQIIACEEKKLKLDSICFLVSDSIFNDTRQILIDNKSFISPVVLANTGKATDLENDISKLLMLVPITEPFKKLYRQATEHRFKISATMNPVKIRDAYSEHSRCVDPKKSEKLKKTIMDFETKIGSKVDGFLKQLETRDS